MTRKLEYVDFNQVYFELNFLDSPSNTVTDLIFSGIVRCRLEEINQT